MDGLSPIERKKLKARAHSLDPIIHLGGKGLTEAVIAEIGRALDAHEHKQAMIGHSSVSTREV